MAAAGDIFVDTSKKEKGSTIPLGISFDRRMQILQHFKILAFSDFHHDFHKAKLAKLLKAMPLDSKTSSAKVKANLAAIRSSINAQIEAKKKVNPSRYASKNSDNWDLYDEMSEYMLKLVPEVSKEDLANVWKAEEDVIENYNIHFGKIKSLLLNRPKEDLYTPFTIGGESVAIGIPGKDGNPLFRRNIKITAMPYKVDGKHIPLGAVFEKVTGKQDFTMVIDAGNLRITELSKVFYDPTETRADKIDMMQLTKEQFQTLLGIERNKPYTFRILESIENTSDSAGKAENFRVYPAKPGIEASKVVIKRYTDEGHTSTFYNIHGADETANFFSLLDFTTSRVGDGKVQGIFSIHPEKNPEETVTIDDLGNDSQIGNASRIATNKYVENYHLRNDITKVREFVLPLMTKRAGDWCQALCLLDKIRKYTLIDTVQSGDMSMEEEAEDPKTLDDLKEGESAIGLMTHDQILLSFALLLGINVYFTLKTPSAAGGRISWLLYFENIDEEVPKQLSESRAAEFKAQLQTLLSSIDNANEEISLKLQSIDTQLKEELSIKSIGDIRHYLFNLFALFNLKKNILQINSSFKAEVMAIYERFPYTTKDTFQYKSLNDNFFSIAKNNQIFFNKINLLHTDFPTEWETIETLFKDIVDKKSIQTLNSYKQVFLNIMEPIKEGIQSFAKETNSIFEAPNQLTLDIDRKGAAPRSDGMNTTKLLKDIQELFRAASIPTKGRRRMAGGGPLSVMEGGVLLDIESHPQQIVDAFHALLSYKILITPSVPLIYEDGRIFIKNLLRQLSTPLPTSPIYDTENFIAPLGGYVVDKDGMYYSVIDNYIVRKADCYKFITPFGDECEFINADSFSNYDLTPRFHEGSLSKNLKTYTLKHGYESLFPTLAVIEKEHATAASNLLKWLRELRELKKEKAILLTRKTLFNEKLNEFKKKLNSLQTGEEVKRNEGAKGAKGTKRRTPLTPSKVLTPGRFTSPTARQVLNEIRKFQEKQRSPTAKPAAKRSILEKVEGKNAVMTEGPKVTRMLDFSAFPPTVSNSEGTSYKNQRPNPIVTSLGRPSPPGSSDVRSITSKSSNIESEKLSINELQKKIYNKTMELAEKANEIITRYESEIETADSKLEAIESRISFADRESNYAQEIIDEYPEKKKAAILELKDNYLYLDTFRKYIAKNPKLDFATKYFYIQLRWYLLLHDILYTRLEELTLKAEDFIDYIDKDKIQYDTNFESELLKFKNDLSLLMGYLTEEQTGYKYRYPVMQYPNTRFTKAGGKLFAFRVNLARVRYAIFELYYSFFEFHTIPGFFPDTTNDETQTKLDDDEKKYFDAINPVSLSSNIEEAYESSNFQNVIQEMIIQEHLDTIEPFILQCKKLRKDGKSCFSQFETIAKILNIEDSNPIIYKSLLESFIWNTFLLDENTLTFLTDFYKHLTSTNPVKYAPLSTGINIAITENKDAMLAYTKTPQISTPIALAKQEPRSLFSEYDATYTEVIYMPQPLDEAIMRQVNALLGSNPLKGGRRTKHARRANFKRRKTRANHHK